MDWLIMARSDECRDDNRPSQVLSVCAPLRVEQIDSIRPPSDQYLFATAAALPLSRSFGFFLALSLPGSLERARAQIIIISV